VVAVRPPDSVLAAGEDTAASRALLADPTAVGVYDRVPATAATAVFSLDKRTDVFIVHAASAAPSGGGSVSGHGRMWVAPEAERDPRAVRMVGEGSGVNGDALLRCYVPAGVIPAPIRIGAVNGSGTMEARAAAPLLLSSPRRQPAASRHLTAPSRRAAESVSPAPAGGQHAPPRPTHPTPHRRRRTRRARTWRPSSP
jgi:hypothetical protein